MSETLTTDGLISEYSYDPYGALVSRNTYDYDSAAAGRYDLAEEDLFLRYDEGLARDSEGNIVPGGVSENFVGFAFNGEEQSRRTGLQYLRARYYDSSSGNFISMDSYEGSILSPLSQNRYTYAENDPVNNFDPSGHAAASSKGIERYVDSSDINELRAFMQGAAMYQGVQAANENFYGKLMSAQATSFMNYGSISGISKSTANYYIEQGIRQATALSLNYGCSKPAVSDEAALRYAGDIYTAKESINDKIEQIKANKKIQYDNHLAYQEYLRELEAWEKAQTLINRAIEKLASVAGKLTSSLMAQLGKKPSYTPRPYPHTSYSARTELTSEAIEVQRERAQNFFNGVIDSVKGTVSGIGTAIETIYLVTFGDSKQRQEGGRRIREFTDGVQYLAAHPIKSLESFGEYIKSVAAEEGTSYVVGYGGGELLQFVAGGAAAKAATSAGKAAKATKAVDKVADAGKLTMVDDFLSRHVNPVFQQNVKNAFADDIKVTTLKQDTIVYRYHGGESKGISYWYTPNKTSNPAKDLALPEGNTYKYMDTFIIPKGTTILEGTVAPNFGQIGGGYQFYVPDPTILIKE